ncbi:unnamed protein product [Lactuca saligna]|uniref:Sugar phosphate transporter domain-containing protein n=1 Tax=Lactuca saligna TaxID=75948 RepID=A0AA35VK70_LACSI|nr:unnamed protein product [Lactuca saligna]
MIPVVCVMEWILHSKHYSKEVKCSVVVVVIGVGVCTVTDVKINAEGFLCACVVVLATSLQQIVFILLSCSLVVFCNISRYLCIGHFSAVSFQVLGHMKTVCVLSLGWFLFDSELTFKNIMRMLVAVAGMVIYSWAVDAENSSSKITTHTKHSLTKDELNLLKEGLEDIPIKDYELVQSK